MFTRSFCVQVWSKVSGLFVGQDPQFTIFVYHQGNSGWVTNIDNFMCLLQDIYLRKKVQSFGKLIYIL